MKKILLFTLLALSAFALSIGQPLKEVTISKENGGLAKDNSMWSSNTIKDKVYVMFYVDPDKKKINDDFFNTLKAKKFDEKKFANIAIMNLAATWTPNFIIEKILKEKQKEFPNTIYVKDKNSVLVNEWGLADHNSDILIFSKDAKLLYFKAGKLDKEEIAKTIKIIEENI